MVSCSEGDCPNSTKAKFRKNQFISKWPGRKFLRFYKIPDPEKKKELFMKWRLRIRRRPEDVNKNSQICSEHFADEDFNPYDLNNVQQAESATNMWVRLKPDSIPNTDRGTGELKIHLQSNSNTDGGNSDQPGRKRVRRDIGYIDQLVEENDAILGRSSLISTSTEVGESSQSQEPMATEEPNFEIIPNRYLSVLISADTNNDKGVQCSPRIANSSTQAGLSSMVQCSGPSSKADQVNQDILEEIFAEESDSDHSDDSDEDYIPGTALSQSNSRGKKVTYITFHLYNPTNYLHSIIQKISSATIP